MHIAEGVSIRCLFWTALCLLVYVFCFVGYASAGASIFYFLSVHLAVVALTSIGAWITFRRSCCDSTVLLCALMIIVLGPFGAVVSFLTVLSYILLRNSTVDMDELLKLLYPEAKEIDSERLQQRLMHSRKTRQGGALLPFRDVMADGTARQKQKAIENMVRSFNPDFAPALRDALEDSNNFVRVQAASAMQWLESAFQNKALELERILAKDPGNRKALLKLGGLLLERARSGLLDSESRVELLAKARKKYEACLSLDPENYRAKVGVAYILKELEHYEDLCTLLKGVDLGAAETAEALILYAESLFQTRRLTELRELLKANKGRKAIGLHGCETFEDSVKLWTEGLPAEIEFSELGSDS